MGPGTHLKKRLARGDPGINRLDRIAKAHDIDYDKAKNLKDKWVADRQMIAKIDQLPRPQIPDGAHCQTHYENQTPIGHVNPLVIKKTTLFNCTIHLF